MIKKYILGRLKETSAWIGSAVVFSVIFLPHSVTICLGLFLIATPDAKLHSMVNEWEPTVKDKINGDKK